MDTSETLLTYEQAAELAGIRLDSVKRWVRQGRIVPTPDGRLPRHEVERLAPRPRVSDIPPDAPSTLSAPAPAQGGPKLVSLEALVQRLHTDPLPRNQRDMLIQTFERCVSQQRQLLERERQLLERERQILDREHQMLAHEQAQRQLQSERQLLAIERQLLDWEWQVAGCIASQGSAAASIPTSDPAQMTFALTTPMPENASLRDRILIFLQQRAPSICSLSEVQAAVQASSRRAIREALGVLVKRGVVERSTPGHFKAMDLHPPLRSTGRPQAPDTGPREPSPHSLLGRVLKHVRGATGRDNPRRGILAWQIQKELDLPRSPSRELSTLVEAGFIYRIRKGVYSAIALEPYEE